MFPVKSIVPVKLRKSRIPKEPRGSLLPTEPSESLILAACKGSLLPVEPGETLLPGNPQQILTHECSLIHFSAYTGARLNEYPHIFDTGGQAVTTYGSRKTWLPSNPARDAGPICPQQWTYVRVK